MSQTALVLEAYEASSETELTVPQGATVTVLNVADGWIWCEYNEQEGYIPADCLQLNEPQEGESAPVEEQPVEEQPIEEQPAEEQPAEEQPVEEQPAEEQSGAYENLPAPAIMGMPLPPRHPEEQPAEPEEPSEMRYVTPHAQPSSLQEELNAQIHNKTHKEHFEDPYEKKRREMDVPVKASNELASLFAKRGNRSTVIESSTVEEKEKHESTIPADLPPVNRRESFNSGSTSTATSSLKPVSHSTFISPAVTSSAGGMNELQAIFKKKQQSQHTVVIGGEEEEEKPAVEQTTPALPSRPLPSKPSLPSRPLPTKPSLPAKSLPSLPSKPLPAKPSLPSKPLPAKPSLPAKSLPSLPSKPLPTPTKSLPSLPSKPLPTPAKSLPSLPSKPLPTPSKSLPSLPSKPLPTPAKSLPSLPSKPLPTPTKSLPSLPSKPLPTPTKSLPSLPSKPLPTPTKSLPSLPSKPLPTPAPAPAPAALKKVRAIYHYDAASSEELTLDEGLILEVLSEGDDGWGEGRTETGLTGLYPLSYVEPYDPSAPTNAAIALYDYTATNDTEVSIQQDEHLIIVEGDDGGWTKVTNAAGQTGLVPTSYIE